MDCASAAGHRLERRARHAGPLSRQAGSDAAQKPGEPPGRACVDRRRRPSAQIKLPNQGVDRATTNGGPVRPVQHGQVIPDAGHGVPRRGGATLARQQGAARRGALPSRGGRPRVSQQSQGNRGPLRRHRRAAGGAPLPGKLTGSRGGPTKAPTAHRPGQRQARQN